VIDGYLLDVNMVGHYFNEQVNVMARLRALPQGTLLFVSAIGLGEIEFGHSLTASTDHERRNECDRFINNQFPLKMVIPVTRHTRVHYGILKARLFSAYPPQRLGENHPERCFDRVTGAELGIDENDLWMAAQAIQYNLIMVTNDEMARIRSVAPELDVEDWTHPM
jgi:tRNA(fMet)-specific endonuclease VapC